MAHVNEKFVDFNDLADGTQNSFSDGDPIGKSTGFRSLDHNYRIEAGEVCVVTGFPGSGKSEFVENLSVHLSKLYGYKWAYFTPETKPLHYHTKRIIQKFIGKTFLKKKSPIIGNIHEFDSMQHSELLDGLDFYKENYFLIDGGLNTKIEDIFKIAKKGKDEKGINAIVIDPWNKLESSRPAKMTETDFIGLTLDKISEFCFKTKISCWIVAHPSKPATRNDGKLQALISLYSISGSAHWYNKIDNGIWVYRNQDEGYSKLHILKIKKSDNGALGEIDLNFNPYTGVYSDRYV